MVLEDKVIHVVSGLRPGGGPGGYLHNLQKELSSKNNYRDIISIMSLSNNRTRSKKKGPLRKLLKDVKYRLNSCFPRRKYIRGFQKWTSGKLFLSAEKLNIILKAKVVISHYLYFSIFYLNLQNRPRRQKFYIFNHSPVDCATDTIEEWSVRYKRALSNKEQIRSKLVEIEIGLYASSDGIIAPCKEALEGYFTFDQQIRQHFETLLTEKEVYELPTGIPDMCQALDPQASLSQQNIPTEKTVIGFFGRYHPQKGFDVFCNLVNMSKRNERFFFISAGKEFMKPPRNSSNYMNLGLLHKEREIPYIMSLCDIIVIPNRYTYFDLVALEAMSLGKTIIATATGGNNYLARMSNGFILSEKADANSFYDILSQLKSSDIHRKGQENRLAYEKEFSVSKFLERHYSLARYLLKES